MPTKTHPPRHRPVFAMFALLGGLLLAGPRAAPPALVTAPRSSALHASPASFNPPGGNVGAAVAWAIGLASSLIYVLGYFAKYLPQRQRELFAMYRRSAGSVCGLGRRACARVFGDRAMQRRLLNPACPLSEEWAAVRDALAHAGAAPEALASPELFYADLLTQMQLSEFWRDRAGALATHLRALTDSQTGAGPEADAPAPVTPGAEATGGAVDAPGAVTFLFTDIQDSTAHWEALGRRFGPVKEQHDRLLRALAARSHGREIVTTGDGFFFVFPTGSSAIAFSIALQQATPTDPGLAAACAPVADALPGGILVRVGIHSGERVEGDPGTFDGPNTNKAARVCGAGHGGQILVTGETFRRSRLNLPPATTARDLGTYRLKGIAEDVDILQVEDPRLPLRDFPRLNAASPERVHLPRFLAPFLGRQGDVSRLQEWLGDEGRRLIVLVGPAGVGKTRLSVQAAEGVADRFPDGVWFADLESVTDADGVWARLALRLALSGGTQEPDADRVTRYLSGKRALFVLDNLEQIKRPEEPLRVLLASAPRLQCLASSRERVPLSGSQTFTVAPLPLPDGTGGTLEELEQVESVRFFVERAQAQDHAFTLTPENAPAVAALCRQLEGVPLAMELAAAWTAQMSPSEILEEIGAHLDLLRSDCGDLPERQRTLRASLDWSFSRLAGDEQCLLAELSVFDGGMTRAAAQAVSDVPGTPDLLRALTEKSLLRREETGGRTRLRLLNTTRLYAGEKLDSLPGADGARARHAGFFELLAREQTARLQGAQQADAARTLEDELDNLKAALAWAGGAGRPALTASLALAVGAFWERRGGLRDARPYAQQALDALGAAGDVRSADYASALRLRAGLALDAGEVGPAREDAARLEELARTEGRPQDAGRARNLRGIADRCAGRHAEAAAHFRAALECFEGLGDAAGAAGAQNNLAVTLMEDAEGDGAEAERRLDAALTLRQGLADRRGMAEVLTNLGNLRQAAGDWAGAERFFAQALAHEQALHDTSGVARSLSNLGEVAEAQGRAAQADRLYAAGQYLFGRAGSPLQSYTQGLRERLAAQHPALRSDHEAAFQAAAEKPQDALIAWAVGEA